MLLKPFRCVVDCVSWIHAILCGASISLAKLLITFGLGKFSTMKLAYVPNLKEMRKTYFQAEKKNVFDLSNSCASVYLDLICQQVLCNFFNYRVFQSYFRVLWRSMLMVRLKY